MLMENSRQNMPAMESGGDNVVHPPPGTGGDDVVRRGYNGPVGVAGGALSRCLVCFSRQC